MCFADVYIYVYIYMYIYRDGQNRIIYTVYDRIFCDFPAKNIIHTPYIYGSGQPYIFVLDLLRRLTAAGLT